MLTKIGTDVLLSRNIGLFAMFSGLSHSRVRATDRSAKPPITNENRMLMKSLIV